MRVVPGYSLLNSVILSFKSFLVSEKHKSWVHLYLFRNNSLLFMIHNPSKTPTDMLFWNSCVKTSILKCFSINSLTQNFAFWSMWMSSWMFLGFSIWVCHWRLLRRYGCVEEQWQLHCCLSNEDCEESVCTVKLVEITYSVPCVGS